MLPRTRISSRIGLSLASREILRTPPGARAPAEVSIRNVNTVSSIVFIKTLPNDTGGEATATDHGVALGMGESFTWSNAPENCTWYASSSVGGCPITIEANWRDAGYEYPIYRGY